MQFSFYEARSESRHFLFVHPPFSLSHLPHSFFILPWRIFPQMKKLFLWCRHLHKRMTEQETFFTLNITVFDECLIFSSTVSQFICLCFQHQHRVCNATVNTSRTTNTAGSTRTDEEGGRHRLTSIPGGYLPDFPSSGELSSAVSRSSMNRRHAGFNEGLESSSTDRRRGVRPHSSIKLMSSCKLPFTRHV